MATAAWIIYDIFLDIVEYFLLDRKLTCKERAVVAVMVIVGLTIASFSFYSDHQDSERAFHDSQTIDSLNRRISDPKIGLPAIYNQLAISNREQAALLRPGLKKESLELASQLMSNSTEIIRLAAQHPSRGTSAPTAPAQAEFQREIAAADAAHERSKLEAAELLSDYKNKYAANVSALKKEFIDQGDTNWRDEPYSNPATIQDIQHIGFELSQHANNLE